MTFFTPPSVNEVAPCAPPGTPGQSRLAYSLFRHMRARPAGVNVYILSDGTVTEDDPDGTRVVWNADGYGDDAATAKYVVRVFYGGHDDYEVNATEAALLTGAGYTLH